MGSSQQVWKGVWVGSPGSAVTTGPGIVELSLCSPGYHQKQCDFWGTEGSTGFLGNSAPWWPKMEQLPIRANPAGAVWGDGALQ